MNAKHEKEFDIDRYFNLQLFAGGGDDGQDEGGGADDGGKDGGGKDAGGQDEGGKKLTQAEVDALIDRRMAKERREAQRRQDEAVRKAVEEAEERARMSEEERTRHDREKADKDAREREEKLKAREAEITRRELRARAIDTLIERELPKELAALLDYSGEDACDKSLDEVEKVFRASVQAGIDARIAQGGGKLGASGGGKPDTDKMSDAEYYASLGRPGK